MSDNHKKTNCDELNQADTRELHHLCSRVYDEVITDEEMTRLDELLHNSAAARRLYFRYVSFHNLLLTKAGIHHQSEAEALRRHVTTLVYDEDIDIPEDLDSCSIVAKKSNPPLPRKRLLVACAIAATLLVAAIGIFWPQPISRQQIAKTSNKAESDRPVDPELPTVPLTNKISAAARLSFVSPDTRWQNNNDAFLRQTAVPIGSTLALTQGEIELTYNSGTKLLLVAPAEFLVESAGGKLFRGGLIASVTEAGHGFTIETPNGKIVDLGTEFGVAVDDFGVSEVSVFQGKVEAFPWGTAAAGKKVELTKGRGLQWSQDNLTPLNADLRRFASSVLDRANNFEQVNNQTTLVDNFRKVTLDTAAWNSIGGVQATSNGLLMSNGSAATGSQPYLVSTEQFDPAKGPVVVTCDFRFAEVHSEEPLSFSILTRSTNQRGVAQPPWSGTLATCVRCSFGSEIDASGGRLQAGVKLESNRELTNISWSGYRAPEQDALYRVVMRDDGVNVSFTVSLREDPTVSKTVTCRSLFRGEENHVALEGSVLGSVLIDRVEISQDLSAGSFSSYSDFATLVLNGRQQRKLEQSLLAKLAPADGEPILQDDFEHELLDANRWSFLGDVLVRDGSVQIGLPNARGHIDTWKERSYLLTRESIDSKQGTLTILGKMKFADNFLSGYGASFSVMTRAANMFGHDPGWANFVLQRGIRANFWPAAWDTKHSLEIHEIPTVNSINLLAIQGLKVSPQVQSYLFRAVDDGQSMTLTIVDPNRPENRMTISSPTTSDLNRGYIGFESCWGSPVTLDEVRIYQHRRSETDTPIPAKER